MGKRIPGKKHHGIKDPEKQKQRRDALLKQKINSAPKKIDDQEVPKKLQRLIKPREEAKKYQKKEKKPKNDGLLDSSKHMGFEMKLPGMKKSLRPIPVFKQHPEEQQRQFFRRVNQEVNQFMKQKEYEAKYDVDLVKDPESGKTKFVQREKDEIDEHVDQIKAKKLAKKGIVIRSKEEKRKEKRLKEKEKRLKKKGKSLHLKKLSLDEDGKEEDHIEFEDLHFKDKIEFNEIAHAPPKLSSIKDNESRKPGKKELLLANPKKVKKIQLKANTAEEKVGKAKKFKQRVSLAKQQMLNAERLSVIEQYRAIKQKSYTF